MIHFYFYWAACSVADLERFFADPEGLDADADADPDPPFSAQSEENPNILSYGIAKLAR